MSTITKLRIDISEGTIEAEGSESFVLAVYEDFKQQLADKAPSATRQERSAEEKPAAPAQKTARKSKKAASNGSSPKPKAKSKGGGPTMLKDLDLSSGKQGRLKDFHAQFDAKSAPDHNLIFVYFLQYKLGITGITENHVYTCYRDVGVKVPGAFRQSLFNTANRNGWLDTSDMENIVVSTRGMNHLEHDFPKKAKA
ncbi:hypothetical protein [Luteimonas granuli]|uniref:Uncharacterized protein n=1 Tax=Luteimonas granuli TaxID=1176533 RepID=A0A518N6Y7_9GAMM|nr:hypothetical protein [Luteimonas granuli]QDW67680.1 hypothetical protein FPZ22_12995 [Luteimonas granuli]